MSAAHTPGPWQYFSGNRSIWSADRAICGVHGPRKAPADYELAEIEANARLIAAAPTTAQMAMEFTLLVERYVRGPDIGQTAVSDVELSCAMYLLRSHIAKATGSAE